MGVDKRNHLLAPGSSPGGKPTLKPWEDDLRQLCTVGVVVPTGVQKPGVVGGGARQPVAGGREGRSVGVGCSGAWEGTSSPQPRCSEAPPLPAWL